MSCLGSTRTNFSTSEMSLASSALMSALSTCTMSDADYETSDEQLLSPAARAVDAHQISQGSSNLRWTSSLLSSQSVSCLADASEDLAASSDADRYAMTVKSDTCLNQQSKIISEFINDMRLQEPQCGAELSEKNSSTSVQTEFFPATNASDSPYGSIIDVNIADAIEEHSEHQSEEKVTARRADEKPVRSTLSETRHQIIENLAQVTSDKLFAKGGLRCLADNSGCRSSPVTGAIGERPSSRVGESPAHHVFTSSSSSSSSSSSPSRRREFQRCRGVESLLQIDYELQPLNLMLSRLLAEFRAMDLRGKLGYVDPELGDSEGTNRRLLGVDTFADVHQLQPSRRQEEHTKKFLSHEHLGDNPATSSAEAAAAAASIAQISRSCEDNCLLSRDSNGAKGINSSCRTKSVGKHPECSNETERNPQCQRETTTRCTVDDRGSQKAISGEEEIGGGLIRLLEIASTN